MQLHFEKFQTFQDNGVDVYLCKIRNVLADEALGDASVPAAELLNAIRPARTVGGTYFSWDGRALGNWGEIMKRV